MGPRGCPETSVFNYYSTLLNIQMNAGLIYKVMEALNHVIQAVYTEELLHHLACKLSKSTLF